MENHSITPFEHKKVTHYELTAEDFKHQIDNPEKYKFPEKITRENFLSALMDSFAKSRGSEVAQWMYFKWLSLNTGFDYQTTLAHFHESQGNGLSTNEHDLFNNTFKKAHTAERQDPLASAFGVIKNISDPEGQRHYEREMPSESLQNIQPRELMDKINTNLQKYAALEAK